MEKLTPKDVLQLLESKKERDLIRRRIIDLETKAKELRREAKKLSDQSLADKYNVTRARVWQIWQGIGLKEILGE
jgi:hypothetical protein